MVAASLGESELASPPIVDAAGTIHLLWHNELIPGGTTRVLYAAFRNDAWTPEEEVYRSPYNYFRLIGVPRTDSAGRLYALITNTPYNGQVYYITRGASGWQTPIFVINTPSSASFIAEADWSGGVHIYEDQSATPPLMWYSHWRNGSFVVQNRPISGLINRHEAALDGLNNLHLFWIDYVPVPGGSVYGLYHQCLKDNRDLLPAEIASDQQAVSAPIIAADERSRVAAVWNEYDPKRVRLAVWTGCDRTDATTVAPLSGTNWSPRAVTISATPERVCMLLLDNYYPARDTVVCSYIP